MAWAGKEDLPLLPTEPTSAGRASVPSGVPSAASKAAPASAAVPAASVPSIVVQRWFSVPRVVGHLEPRDLGLVINIDDPYSVQVGEYYAKARGLTEPQILRVRLPIKSALTRDEFTELSKQVNDFYGDRVQALALAWRLPYAVDCNSITGALTMGFDAQLCAKTCAASKPSRYFGSASTRPYKDYGMRLSMLLAAPSFNSAKAMIDRGVKSDGTLGLRGALPANVHMVSTSDSVRSVRQYLFPPPGPVPQFGLNIHLDKTDALKNSPRVLMYLTGRAQVEYVDTVDFLPGALADHLTSFGGILDKPHGQMTVLSWIDAGATASYGTTSEPCAHLQKFPHPQALLLFYAQGGTALESYWKSVAWPQQGLFVGEPLAAPFDRSSSEQTSASR
ncbi:TIGR03790 family protein [Aquabacterium soli]|uniref:TIGR03790 family protein n=1 Tax=Aquabacterium soli TaxID=2493092 RepID=A0A3R8U268_9BURK|nr:TIGR03790 family protein [Aquabacterium soli]